MISQFLPVSIQFQLCSILNHLYPFVSSYIHPLSFSFSFPSLLFCVAPHVRICLFILLAILHFSPLQSSMTGIETKQGIGQCV